MRPEEVYNISIHLPEKELERLYTLLSEKVVRQKKRHEKPVKKKLITDEEARKFILRTVFRVGV